ncbi:dioxygenase [Vibrio fluvialis]|uniref:DODA-type extradiol aromatic ring-opening family dioxygenase n=1 Tax=Vibrio fluvialis TaxID=676 RepID=UPI001ABEB042|nr:class III extradiol ring-cleavage dioxygenase [Vibrio fluvialis]MBY7768132.1 dioxygenase [Vibrio fluvialis]MBY8042440.1 dioxygenase [Vibrio fluvialis]MBY8051047.1 dioxygenase [Vibrio fluvialis]QTH10496.1 dioxygenase [Vibrio fluvialis]HDM8047603.1 dioxygenase [Vibrio fluvialis]
MMNQTQRMPALFLSHGSPMMAIEHSETTEFFQQLGTKLPKPKAIVIFSAHFDRRGPVVITSGHTLGTIHDFYGFPQPLYDIEYPAQGAPELALKAEKMLKDAGIPVKLDKDQGLDHGAWIPMLYLYPNIDVPIIQVSINSAMDAVAHFEIGRWLRPLREEGVLFVGSGGISHNLREIFSPMPDPNRVSKVNQFTNWVSEQLARGNVDALLDYLDQGPHARFNHPTPDHYLPLPSVLGTSYEDEIGQVLHRAIDLEILALDAYGFGMAAA